jgi:tyrosine aminotransferase
MEDNGGGEVAWRFGAANPSLQAASALSLRKLVHRLYGCVDRNDPRPLAPLGHGDPSPFACFRAAAAAEEAVAAAATSGKYNSYPTAAGVTEACRYIQQTCLDLPAPAILSLSPLSPHRPLPLAPSIVTGV